MAGPSQVIVLIEDRRHQQLIYRYLYRFGLNERQVRFELTQSGSGEQWVRERFPIEVKAYRRRSARAQTRLIVAVDADKLTVQARLAQLDQKLSEAKIDPVRPNEQVARLVPRRNVETWLLCLNDVIVNEETDYKNAHHPWEELKRTAAETLYSWTRPNAQAPEQCVPSLRDGIIELRKLDFSVA